MCVRPVLDLCYLNKICIFYSTQTLPGMPHISDCFKDDNDVKKAKSNGNCCLTINHSKSDFKNNFCQIFLTKKHYGLVIRHGNIFNHI